MGVNGHIGCYAHTLNLIVKGSISKVSGLEELIKSVKSVVGHFKHSIVCSDELRKMQEIEGKIPLKLKQDVVTRWNSTYLMLDRYCSLSHFITAIVSKLRLSIKMPSNDDIEHIRDVIKVLEPIESITRELSAEKHITISKIIPISNCLLKCLRQMKVSSKIANQLIDNLCVNTKNRLKVYEKNDFIRIGTLLDPRFKKILFSTPELADLTVKSLSQKLNDVFHSMDTDVSVSDNNHIETSSVWDFHDSVVSSQSFDGRNTHNEIAKYIQMSLIDRSNDPIHYWAKNKSVFPRLYQLALKSLNHRDIRSFRKGLLKDWYDYHQQTQSYYW